MAFNRLALALLISLFSCLAFAAAPALQDASQLLQQGHPDQALGKINAYLADNPKDPKARFMKGIAQAELNQTQDAIKTFTALTQDYPELPEPYNNLAVLYASQGQFEQAKDSLEKAIRNNPTYATAQENLGDIYAKMASQAYDKALQLDKNNSSARAKLALIHKIFAPQDQAKTESGQRHVAASLGQPALSGPAAPAVEKTIRDWAAAWSQRNVQDYLSFYAPNFVTPDGMSRSDWQALRTERLTTPSRIQVDVFDFNIEQNGNRATAHFREHYKSNLLNVTVGKAIQLEQQAGVWKIVSEK